MYSYLTNAIVFEKKQLLWVGFIGYICDSIL